MDIFFELYSLQSVRTVLYILKTLKINHNYPLSIIERDLNNLFYSEFQAAQNEITTLLGKSSASIETIDSIFKINDPYYSYLLSIKKPIEILIYVFLLKYYFRVEDGFFLEKLQNDCGKYGVVRIENHEDINFQGIFYSGKFYYHSMFLPIYWNINNLSPLIKTITSLPGNNNIFFRLDDNLAIPSDKYQEIKHDAYAMFYGKEINLDDIRFPKYPSGIPMCVYDPKTNKKIQFFTTREKDGETWIHIEELFPFDKDKIQVTKYLHSIFDEQTKTFNHIDGSVNLYNTDCYKLRLSQKMNTHATEHKKIWLVEGNFNILDWGKLVLYYFDDYDLIFDAFTGKLAEDIITEILI
ncbi:hypothetical protein [Leptolinea tardivitalis]|uniref:Uncharacterized protein n=1 Tax=Leptolinea tardivitalis TaxID=229920 RepID=A0A0P6XN11_9CHLR|nr:hypothetical protein [Leptolinea tardivitalis]KPL70329.1 hypothetical protein ADM99_14315 [Leptolinea tardivitalis]GAP21891.1 hypothetical protein LTAR_02109 [Leptolinea tardivitalis]